MCVGGGGGGGGGGVHTACTLLLEPPLTQKGQILANRATIVKPCFDCQLNPVILNVIYCFRFISKHLGLKIDMVLEVRFEN